MNSCITIDDRERMIITGTKSIEMLTDTEISLYTEHGDLIIKGTGLESEEYDPDGGILRIKGRIDSLSYTSLKRHIPDNIISKLFR